MIVPTTAFTRSWALTLVLGLAAVVLHRVDLFVLAVPFIVHLVWALAVRPQGVPEVEASASTVLVEEGAAMTYRLRAPGWSGLVAAQVGLTHGMAHDPVTGAAVGADGEVAVGVQAERWGRYTLPVAPIVLVDASGAWRGQAERRELRLVVRPRTEPLSGGSGVSRPIGMSGVHRSRDRGEGTELAQVRGFTPGDRLRRINWRITSRLPGVHVNAMLVERDTDVLIVTDSPPDVGIEGEATSLDATVRAVAGITQHYCGFGDRVALHDLGTRIGSVRPGTGHRQVKVMLHQLARTNPATDASYHGRRVPSLSSGTLVFVCSPLLEPMVLDEIVRLRRLGAEVVVVDTLPDRVGRSFDDHEPATFLGEAWMLRRLGRDEPLLRLEELGIPVVSWQGPSSLAVVLQAMEAARTAPRMRR